MPSTLKKFTCWMSTCGYDTPPDPDDPTNQPDNADAVGEFEATDHEAAALAAATEWRQLWLKDFRNVDIDPHDIIQGQDWLVGVIVRDEYGDVLFFDMVMHLVPEFTVLNAH